MTTDVAAKSRGITGAIERLGNRLPDPVFIFFYLIGFLVLLSVVAAFFGLAADHPINGEEIKAHSLLSGDNLRRLLTQMPQTFTHFHPLGYTLVIMLGAGVAERSGMLGAAMRAGVHNAPKFLLTPTVVAVGLLGNLASDAADVVLIPLARAVRSPGNHRRTGRLSCRP